MDDAGTQPMYPRLVRRVRAVLFDTIVFVLLIFGWMLSLPAMVEFDLPVKVAPLVVAFLVLEPGLVAFTGGTLGHHFMGLRVRDATHDRCIGFFRAVVREILRNLFGWLSFVFVFVTRQHQALHDYATATIVVLRRPDAVPAYDRLPAREEESSAPFVYPSRTRRVIVVLGYVVLLTFGLGLMFARMVSDECIETDHCTRRERTLEGFAQIVWVLGVGAIMVSGWRGRLPGCRRVPAPTPAADSPDLPL